MQKAKYTSNKIIIHTALRKLKNYHKLSTQKVTDDFDLQNLYFHSCVGKRGCRNFMQNLLVPITLKQITMSKRTFTLITFTFVRVKNFTEVALCLILKFSFILCLKIMYM